MPEYRSPALAQAFSELPGKWYERQSLKRDSGFNRKFDLMNGLAIFPNLFLWYVVNPQESLAPYVAGGAIFLASSLADSMSTSSAYRSFEKAKENDIEVQHVETNPVTRKLLDNGRSIYFHPKALVREVPFTIGSSAFPLNGVIFATGKFMLALSNFRLAKRYRRAVEIKRQRAV